MAVAWPFMSLCLMGTGIAKTVPPIREKVYRRLAFILPDGIFQRANKVDGHGDLVPTCQSEIRIGNDSSSGHKVGTVWERVLSDKVLYQFNELAFHLR